MIDLDALDTLKFTRTDDGHVGTLMFNRPDRLNAFTIAMWDEMRSVADVLVADRELRALVVTGAGRAFSSGIDTAEFGAAFLDPASIRPTDGTPPRDPDPVIARILQLQDAFSWLETAPFATIAAIRGYAYGAGLQCALACDLRVSTPDARLGLLEFNWGIIPDLGGTQRLARLVGVGKAKEMIYTAAKVSAADATAFGLIERIVDDGALDAAALDLARTIAAQPPLALRGAKRALNAAGTVSIDDGLRIEAHEQAVCLRSADLVEAVTAALEARAPVYRGE